MLRCETRFRNRTNKNIRLVALQFDNDKGWVDCKTLVEIQVPAESSKYIRSAILKDKESSLAKLVGFKILIDDDYEGMIRSSILAKSMDISCIPGSEDGTYSYSRNPCSKLNLTRIRALRRIRMSIGKKVTFIPDKPVF